MSERAGTLEKHGGPAVGGREGKPILIESVGHSYGEVQILKNVSLAVGQGEFLTLLGPSGSGKTTLLRLLAGMQMAASGKISFGDRDVTRLPANERNVGFVFQNYSLFPHMNVHDNVAFGLKMRRLSRDTIDSRVREALELVDLAGFEGRHPNTLSGGQQQRVSLARAIAIRPDVLLMDEPLGSLDKRLRQRLQDELRALQRRLGITTIYVTHDQDEAFAMSHRIAVMKGGLIQQVAAPERIYRNPANEFVARFVGDINVVAHDNGGKGGIVGVRPERVAIARTPAVAHRGAGRLESLVFYGQTHRARVRLPSGAAVIADLYEHSHDMTPGDEVYLTWRDEDIIDLVDTEVEAGNRVSEDM